MKRRLLILRFLVAAGGEYTWQSLKNCVKFCLGRRPWRSYRMLFFPQYLLHATGLRPLRAITYSHWMGMEGAGSQATCIVNAINFARASGLTYLHTPFTVIHHADRPMPEWVAAWESLFNLGLGEAACDGARRDVVNYSPEVYSDVELCLGWEDREAELARSFRALIPELRRKYYANKSPRVAEQVTVALHMRRGDVTAQNGYMFTSTKQALHTLSDVKSVLDSRRLPYRLCVYSQGSRADFAELASLGVEFFLDADPLWTMQELIEADVLILAKSTFSTCAAMISDGIKVFEPIDWSGMAANLHWLLPSDDWLPCQPDGSMDTLALDRRLSVRTQVPNIL